MSIRILSLLTWCSPPLGKISATQSNLPEEIPRYFFFYVNYSSFLFLSTERLLQQLSKFLQLVLSLQLKVMLKTFWKFSNIPFFMTLVGGRASGSPDGEWLPFLMDVTSCCLLLKPATCHYFIILTFQRVATGRLGMWQSVEEWCENDAGGSQ